MVVIVLCWHLGVKGDQMKDPNEPLNCPHCGVSLLGDKIPQDISKHYSGTHWKREIGIYDRDLDRTVAYRCPDCGKEWPIGGAK